MKMTNFNSQESNFELVNCDINKVEDIIDNVCKTCEVLYPGTTPDNSDSKKYYDEGECKPECPNVYLNYICYDDCSKIGTDHYKEGKTCVTECSDVNGLDTSSPKECKAITIASISSTPLYAHKEAQSFDITFSVEVDSKIDVTKVKNIKILTLDASDEETNPNPQVLSCAYSTADEDAKKKFKCDQFIALPVGNYNLYWYKSTDDAAQKQGTALKITLAPPELTNLKIDKIVPDIKELPSSGTFTIELTYKGQFKATYEIAFVDVNDVVSFSLTSSDISITENTATITLPANTIEGQFRIRTKDPSFGESAIVVSPEPILFYKSNLLVKYPVIYHQKEKPITNIVIEFDNFVFKERIATVTYTKPSKTAVPVPTYVLSPDGLKMTIQNNITPPIVYDVVGNHVFDITFKASTSPLTLKHTVTVFEYPTTVVITNPIFIWTTADDSMVIRFNTELAHKTIFKSIKAVGAGTEEILFTLSDRINPPVETFDYKLTLANKDDSNNWQRFTKGIQFSDMDGQLITTIAQTPLVFIVLKNDQRPITLDPSPTSLSILPGTKEVIVKFVSTQPVYSEYFTAPAKITIGLTDFTIEYDEGTKGVKIISTADITSEITFTSFGQEIKVQITVCAQYQILEANTCKFCKTKDPPETLYYENGVCKSECTGSNVYHDFICYSECPDINGQPAFATGKKCDTTCLDGYIGMNKLCVLILKITEVTSPLYANITQTIIITTHPIPGYTGNFIMKKRGESTDLKTLNCNPRPARTTQYDCPNTSLLDVEAGSYDLYLENPVNPQTNDAYPIEIIIKPTILLNKITPDILQLPTDANPAIFTLDYDTDFDPTGSITLVNIDTNVEKLITKDTDFVIKVDKNVELKISQGLIPEGTYKIKTTGYGETGLSTKTFTVIKDVTISFVTTPIIAYYIKDTELNNFQLTLSPVFPKRIVMVEVKQTGGSIETNYSFNKDTYVMTITDKITVSQEIKIIITYKSYPTDKTLEYTFKSVDFPEITKIEGKFYYHSETSNKSIPLKVIFDKPMIIGDNDFDLIKTKTTNIKFTPALTQLNGNTQYNLFLENPTTPSPWGTHTNIVFSSTKIKNTNQDIIDHPLTFKILSKDQIPHTLVKDKFTYKISDNIKEVTLTFIEVVDDVFYEKPNILLDPNSYTYTCSIAKHDTLANSIKMTCNVAIPSTTEFTIQSFDQPVKFTVEVTNCGSLPEIDGVCACPDETKYAYKGTCYTQCPPKTITEGFICYDSCTEIVGNGKNYLDVDQLKCVSDCDPLKFKYEALMRCYNKCPLIEEGIRLYVLDNSCRKDCPSTHVPDAYQKCIIAKDNQCINDDQTVKCITSCPYGTYFNIEKQACVYQSSAENPEVAQCKPEDCKNDGTCSIANNKPVCACKEEFFGTTCQNKRSEVNVEDYAKDELDKVFDKTKDKIDCDTASSITAVVELTSVLSKEKDAINKITDEDLKKLSDNLINTIKEANNANTSKKEVVPFVSLTIKALILKLKQHKSLRRLDATTDMETNLRELIDQFLESTAITELVNDITSIKFIDDDGQSFKAQVFNSQSIALSFTLAQQNNISSLDIKDIATKANLSSYGIVKIDLIKDYQVALTGTTDTAQTRQTLMKFLVVDLSKDPKKIVKQADLPAESLYTTTIPLPSIQGNLINTQVYESFAKKKLDIYNAEDEAFTKTCYYNWELDFDLPQKYRFNDLYGRKILANTDTKCVYKGYDTAMNGILLECPVNVNEEGLSLGTTDVPTVNADTEKVKEVDNLPITCSTSIASVVYNFGFWTYLLLFVICLAPIITVGVMHYKPIAKDYFQPWINQDEIVLAYTRAAVKTLSTTHFGDQNRADSKNDRNFGQLLLHNFLTIHPLTNVFRGSIVTPLMLKFSILLYNIFNLFGFNALYYSESMIGKKMTDDFRNNFAYPMKSEFHKIIYALLTSMALTMIVRAINLVTMKKKEELGEKLSNTQTVFEKYDVCKAFWIEGFIRRVIAYVFMLALSIFLFYYSVVFCGIYVHTQYGWFYSGIWSLLMDWVIFAPVSILIITGVESYKPLCGYYAKQVFWF